MKAEEFKEFIRLMLIVTFVLIIFSSLLIAVGNINHLK